jgi:PAS domain S-box-containing protein
MVEAGMTVGQVAPFFQSDSELAERFRLLIESIKDYAIFILDADGHVRTWNPGAERIKGYREREIVGRHFSVFYPAEVNPPQKCATVLQVATREGRFEEEGWRIRKDGSRFWANVTITALRDKSGSLVGFAIVTQDLTARRNAELETRRFRTLVESVRDYAIITLDATGHVTTWNPGAEHIKGYGSGEIIGQHFSVFYPPEAIAEGKCELELEVATREGRFEEEGWRLRKDGSRYWANTILTPTYEVDGSLSGFAKVTRDLTKRREAEAAQRALVEQQARLAESERTRQFQERFIAVLGHDLRNPLASLDVGTSILQRGVENADAVRILARMQSSASRMGRMIDQILDLTRTRLGGGLELRLQSMDLRDTLVKIVEELRIAHRTSVIELNALSLEVVADHDRMEQVFSNLIGNALAHGAPGTPVQVDAYVDGPSVTVSVHNMGLPIAPHLQATLFDPFRRGERESRTANTAGLGLGLYISSEIVRGHQGTIEVESSAELGTIFRVKIPLREATQ